jgi:hypothetical protein
MLQGFIERVVRPTLIVRVGEGATRKPLKYERTLFAEEVVPGVVELKAYDQGASPRLFTAFMQTLYAGGVRVVTYERLEKRPRTLIFHLGPEGAVSMTVRYHDDPVAAFG